MKNPVTLIIERINALNLQPSVKQVVIGGIFAVLAAFIISSVSLAVALLQKSQRPILQNTAVVQPLSQTTTPASPYAFAHAVIDSLAYAADARQTLRSIEDKGDATANALHSMTNARIAIGKLERAKGRLEHFSGSTDGTIRTASQGFCMAYDQLIDALNHSIKSEERLMMAQGQHELAAIVSDTSKYLAQADEAWKLLVYATAAASHALTDNEREENGKLRYLKITTAQRADLVDGLERFFGPQLKVVSKQANTLQRPHQPLCGRC